MMDRAPVWLFISAVLLTTGPTTLTVGCGISASVTMTDGTATRTAHEGRTLALNSSTVERVEMFCTGTALPYSILLGSEEVYNGQSNFVFSGFDLNRQGRYTCRCQEGGERSLNLVVLPGFENDEFVGTAVEGDTIRLPCQLTNTHPELEESGLYTVQWISSRGDLNEGRYSKLRDNYLIFTNFSKEDTEYVYQCMVTMIGTDDLHGLYPRSGPRRLHLLEKPVPEILTNNANRVSCGAFSPPVNSTFCLTITYIDGEDTFHHCDRTEVRTIALGSPDMITCEVTFYSNVSNSSRTSISLQTLSMNSTVSFPTTPTTPPQPIIYSVFIGVIAALVVLVVAAVGACVPIIVCMQCRSQKYKQQRTRRMTPSVGYHTGGQSTAEMVQVLNTTADAWEVPQSEIELGIKLGQGTYGAVYSGQLSMTAMSPKIYAHKREMEFEGKSHLTVAVKVLRHSSSESDRQLFLDEINIMKRASDGNSPHVLKMIGCVTTTLPMMVLLQFVPHGNLKDYLLALKMVIQTRTPVNAPHLKRFTCFGYQIASGMEYLMTKEVIHRDLACRNILVGDNELLKICDFGLAKEILEYTSALKTRLPIRWMAPEALLRGEFSEKSDVWAYGMCLWEIFSFGALPYKGMGNTVVLSRVMGGYRLESPEGCPEEIYSIMRECWSVDKEARPTFLELREKFDGLISHEERYNYMQWNGECAVESVENATQPSGGDGSAAGLAEVIEMPPTEPIASSDSGPSVQSAVPPAQPSASSLDVELITTELA